MQKFGFFGRKLEHSFRHGCTKMSGIQQSSSTLFSSLFYFLAFQVNPFWIQLGYFISLSLVGFLALKLSKPKTTSIRPANFDVFFTSVSASTVSSMSTVEMEVFSNPQLVIMTILMLLGGEVFTSMLGLQFLRSKFITKRASGESTECGPSSVRNLFHLPQSSLHSSKLTMPQEARQSFNIETRIQSSNTDYLKYYSIKYLSYLVSCYLLLVHVVGSSSIVLYLSLVPSARKVLKKKDLQILTFSVFTIVSTFSNCGFIPTNENMVVFKKNSGLLLLLIPQILLGNTLFPPALRFLIWGLKKITKRVEFNYMLKNSREIGYDHLLPTLHSSLLVITVVGFILVQFLLFCYMEWDSESMTGLNSYQKLVGALFISVNSRHTGESVFDLSIISPAILVLFVVMMYLPPYTAFLPTIGNEKTLPNGERQEQKKLVDHLLLSRLSYLVIFIILICITEREKMKEDPLNFNVLNITIEVISAYGNVGFSTGYHCSQQLKTDPYCKDTWTGFSGRWSNKGKFVLILVMVFGRLKKFSRNGGRAWAVS